jgi:3-oxoacyl-[acyl-carrier-protein] synthase-3
VVNASRISRITDFGCQNTGPLFGDLATATLIARSDSRKYPVHFRVLHAAAQKQPAAAPFFNFELRQQVLAPNRDGSRQHLDSRLVFTLDGMGIADAAPRAMSAALSQSLQAAGRQPADLQFVVPHQAGTGIVRLTAMKLEQAGVCGQLINGFTRHVGNVSSCSVPFALQKCWGKLHGLIACPTAAVGDPGKSEVSQGCILLEASPLHERLAIAAA